MNILTECNLETSFLSEAVKDSAGNVVGKNYFIEGVFLQSEVRNHNGRIYPVEVMESAVDQYNSTMIATGRAVGELGHPKEDGGVNLDRISHKIEWLRKDGTNWVGRAKITQNTPNGKIAAALLMDGVKLGVSSRGTGSVRESDGTMYVRDGFRLITAADIVADPSAPDAFVEALVEGRPWIYEHGKWHPKDIDDARKMIRGAKSKNLVEAKLAAFAKFLSSI